MVGKQTRKFWNKINKIKDEEIHHEIYSLGCMLQNLEEYVLKKLKEATNRGGCLDV